MFALIISPYSRSSSSYLDRRGVFFVQAVTAERNRHNIDRREGALYPVDRDSPSYRFVRRKPMSEELAFEFGDKVGPTRFVTVGTL